MDPEAKEAIPVTVADLTPAWVTSVLTAGNHASGPVQTVDPEILGEGEGFIGTIARLRLTYGDGDDGPRSVIAKLPTDVDENRMVGEATGSYEREIRVYTELADRIPAPMPRCLHAAFDEQPGAARLPGLLRFLDRRRPFVVNRAVQLSEWMGRRSTRRYVLVLEDLAPAAVGDQVSGCSPDEAARILEAVAPMHAAFWGVDAPAERHWLLPGDIAVHMFQRIFQRNRPAFEVTFADVLDDNARRLLAHLDEAGARTQQVFFNGAPATLLHGDLRLDNLFVADGDVRAFVDWQAVSLGPAAWDVAYFVSGALDPDVQASELDDLLQRYHRRLLDHGVAGYPWYRFRSDIDRALILLLHRMVGIESIEFGDDRGADLTTGWVRRLVALLDGIAP